VDCFKGLFRVGFPAAGMTVTCSTAIARSTDTRFHCGIAGEEMLFGASGGKLGAQAPIPTPTARLALRVVRTRARALVLVIIKATGSTAVNKNRR
jgi:hypothetical protein